MFSPFSFRIEIKMKILFQLVIFLITMLQTTGRAQKWLDCLKNSCCFFFIHLYLSFFILLEAEEVIYARVGDSVTLNIPDPPKSNFYIYWHFGTEESFFWFSHLGGKKMDLGERNIKIWFLFTIYQLNMLICCNLRYFEIISHLLSCRRNVEK